MISVLLFSVMILSLFMNFKWKLLTLMALEGSFFCCIMLYWSFAGSSSNYMPTITVLMAFMVLNSCLLLSILVSSTRSSFMGSMSYLSVL